jgi:hypothetical protein
LSELREQGSEALVVEDRTELVTQAQEQRPTGKSGVCNRRDIIWYGARVLGRSDIGPSSPR